MYAIVKFACRREYAATAVDIIARRTRLSFLDAEAALEALPKVIDLMAVELNWSRKRQTQEFADGLAFLESMGLSKARIGKLTIEDVRKGRHKQCLEVDDDLLSRTVFTVEELDTLKRKFQEMDDDKDGVISEKDLSATMAKLGFGDVPKVRFLSLPFAGMSLIVCEQDTVQRILFEVDYNLDEIGRAHV